VPCQRASARRTTRKLKAPSPAVEWLADQTIAPHASAREAFLGFRWQL
jgi:hypothetical protein